MAMLSMGAEVNQQYIEHINILLKIKKNFIFIKQNLSCLEEDQKFVNPYLKMYHTVLLSIKASKVLKDKEDVREYIDDLNEAIDNIIDRLEYDFEHNPLRLMGLKATYGLMNTIYTTLLSLGLAVG
eukprot:CAMPEP_0202964318 /NCGR_PEP_ID=MMETSP1396-20130829/8398_1 /ASSEMBLY_ACC=CAM_ASM_000872 /TAXON_ID= /ORGANISM="Pseudokeronopsis sp., Strain Brazil" /LENGTH=125 /DNA_ID=CAMNT_0049686333 /DNA_START=807 /DNA_END=1184 /DNA_ORIENTATION=-